MTHKPYSIILLLLGVLLILQCNLYGQQKEVSSDFYPEFRKKYRTVGLNMTPLLVQFIPFNRSNPLVTGPFYIATKRYYKKNLAVRFGIGLDIDINQEDVFANVRIGWEKRKVISGRWAYYGGIDLMFIGGDLNIPGTKSEDSASIGLAPMWGFEFALTKHIKLSTETALFLGINFGDFEVVPKFGFIPPVSVFLNFRFPAGKRRIYKHSRN